MWTFQQILSSMITPKTFWFTNNRQDEEAERMDRVSPPFTRVSAGAWSELDLNFRIEAFRPVKTPANVSTRLVRPQQRLGGGGKEGVPLIAAPKWTKRSRWQRCVTNLLPPLTPGSAPLWRRWSLPFSCPPSRRDEDQTRDFSWPLGQMPSCWRRPSVIRSDGPGAFWSSPPQQITMIH